jgi:hypothetical protein
VAREAKRRFLSLRVREVSLVDSAANEQEFIVIKRLDQEEQHMAGNNTEVAKADTSTVPAQASTQSGDVEKVTIEVTKAATDATQKAMEMVTKLVGEIGKVANPQGKIETEVAKTVAQPVVAVVDAAAVAPAPTVVAPIATSVVAQATPVVETEKAASFTPGRIASIQNAITDLQKLVSEVAPTNVQKYTEQPAMPNNDALIKTITDLTTKVEKVLGDVQTTTKNLGERLEVIEKTREPSKSISGDGGTEVKTNKSLWTGVL